MLMSIHRLLVAVAALAVSLLTGGSSQAADGKRIVFLAGKPSHGYGSHEHLAGCRILADAIQRAAPGVRCDVYSGGWPESDQLLDGADTIVMYCDGGGGHPALKHLPALAKHMERGVGFVCLHYGVEVPKDNGGPEFLEWLGGYFETDWSVNPHWVASYDKFPEHAITRGVKPFSANDEWYFHMRFRPNMQGVTPILSAVPPASTMSRPNGAHSGNPAVRAEVAKGTPQHMAWAYDRANGGRSFGFTGGHYHWNWGRPEVIKVVCNAICWTAKLDIPADGLPLNQPTFDTLKEGQDESIPARFDADKIKQDFKLTSTAIGNAQGNSEDGLRSSSQAVAGLDVHPELTATLAASEPKLMSLTNLDVDHRGRVWVCEVVNYRRHNGQRPEGDRILILEDTDHDGVMDKEKVYYQGRDIDSAMGICVLGNKVIVSSSPNVWIFTDNDGDDVPDDKQLFFSKTGDPQHDHSAHSFSFGPDGKLYWNFGNTGHNVHDAKGEIVRDMAGNAVQDQGRPYRQGMPFRCNLDGSQFEVLGNNFRNNYEVAVDSYGALWQSDNDDDGNRATRINFVMEYGNYGYVDEMTGEGWRVERTNMESEIPQQHWHLNDPGVVPSMLITGAGSPTGITVYEGDLLPPVFQGQVIHCDAGPNVVRAYPAAPEGAGYKAEIVNMLVGERDRWFRPADVCVAPDGSLFVTDWYDPGVGGHNMQDMERGRLFRLAPPGSKYAVPKFDFSSPAGAVMALSNPAGSVRYMAFDAIQKFGSAAVPELKKMSANANPRLRARAIWAMGKLSG
ncbi:MAG: ThuA domain-containing protein, partial [Pirellulaceae bacterium]|nr:ThuA domain-containing protein [Pirellulaceae bacterium]